MSLTTESIKMGQWINILCSYDYSKFYSVDCFNDKKITFHKIANLHSKEFYCFLEDVNVQMTKNGLIEIDRSLSDGIWYSLCDLTDSSSKNRYCGRYTKDGDDTIIVYNQKKDTVYFGEHMTNSPGVFLFTSLVYDVKSSTLVETPLYIKSVLNLSCFWCNGMDNRTRNVLEKIDFLNDMTSGSIFFYFLSENKIKKNKLFSSSIARESDVFMNSIIDLLHPVFNRSGFKF